MRLRMYLPPVHQQQQPILFLFIFACINTLQSFKNRRSIIVDCFLDKKHALVWVVMFHSKHTFAKKMGKFKMSFEILRRNKTADTSKTHFSLEAHPPF